MNPAFALPQCIPRTPRAPKLYCQRRRPRAPYASGAASDGHNLRARLSSTGEQATQILALVSLPSLPPEEARGLLHDSGALRSDNVQVRLTAAATLGKLGNRGDTAALVHLLTMDPEHSVRAAAASGIGNLLRRRSRPAEAGSGAVAPDVVEPLLAIAENDANFIVRYCALVTLGNVGDRRALPFLISVAMDSSAPPLEAAAAVAALGEIPRDSDAVGIDEEVFNVVVIRARDRDDLVRAAVARTLGLWAADEERRQSSKRTAMDVLQGMNKEEERFGQSALVRSAVTDAILGRGGQEEDDR